MDPFGALESSDSLSYESNGFKRRARPRKRALHRGDFVEALRWIHQRKGVGARQAAHGEPAEFAPEIRDGGIGQAMEMTQTALGLPEKLPY